MQSAKVQQNHLQYLKYFFLESIYNKLSFYFGLHIWGKERSLFGATEVNWPGCDAVELSAVV